MFGASTLDHESRILLINKFLEAEPKEKLLQQLIAYNTNYKS